MNTNHYDDMEQTDRIVYLITRYINGSLTAIEYRELEAWASGSDENLQLFQKLTAAGQLEDDIAWMCKRPVEQKLAAVKQHIHFTDSKQPRRLKKIFLISSVVTAAACLLWICWYGDLLYNQDFLSNQYPIMPATDSSTITLENGAVIPVQNGFVAKSGVTINKKEIDYSNAIQHGQHTLKTSKGGQYKIKLNDGTCVWLNAASVLTYPSVFSGNERKVMLKGEAYFEVAKDPKRPFKVKIDAVTEIQVLGTHFNVKAYAGNRSTVTLTEGRVAIHQRHHDYLLLPGYAASLGNSSIAINERADTSTAIRWRQGVFAFRDATMREISEEAERWYPVRFVYEQEISSLFNATVSRQESLHQLLHLLEMTGKVHFRINKDIIYVLQ